MNKEVKAPRRTAEVLIGSQQALKAVLDTAIDGMILADVETKEFHMGNKAICQMLGYTSEEIKKLRVMDIHPAESLPFVLEKFEAQKRGEITLAENIPLKRQDGRIIYADINSSVLSLKGRTYMLGIFRDISEQKKAKEELLFQNTLLEAQNETSIEGILVVDARGETVLFNKRFAEMWNIPPHILDKRKDDLMLQYVLDQLVEPDLFIEKVQYLYRHKNKKSRDEIVFKNGRVFDRYSSPLIDLKGRYYGRVWYFHDITEHKKAAANLQEAYKKLKETQEELIQSSKMAAMGQLAAGISHELNQPLTGIKGFAQAIFMELEDTHPLKKDLEKIVEQADRMDKIIKNVRFFARKSEFQMKKVEINKPLEDTLTLMKEQLKAHRIKVKSFLAQDLPKVKGDVNQLQQVFLNLISNARDAIDSRKGAGVGELTIKTSLSKNKKNVEVIFKDNGCGVSKEGLDNIFNPFFTTKSPAGGMGLGLSIAYRIIEMHRGKIEVSSKEGEGTEFTITLPIS